MTAPEAALSEFAYGASRRHYDFVDYDDYRLDGRCVDLDVIRTEINAHRAGVYSLDDLERLLGDADVVERVTAALLNAGADIDGSDTLLATIALAALLDHLRSLS